MINFPSCKINLGLHILRKREDGFHEIETAMLEIPWTDVLEIVPADAFSFHSSGLEIPGTGNSCVQAVELLQRDFDFPPVAMQLHKVIPMGGGLGGGSSDGAQALRTIRSLYDLDLTDDQLGKYAAQLGSDCPFFIRGGLQLSRGRGELLSPLTIQLPAFYIVLVNLGIHVPTKDAYAHCTPDPERIPLTEILQLPVSEWKEKLVNDFEKSVFQQHPVLAEIKADLYRAGAIYAAMTGSGSTFFGLFEEDPGAIKWSEEPEFEKRIFKKDL